MGQDVSWRRVIIITTSNKLGTSFESHLVVERQHENVVFELL